MQEYGFCNVDSSARSRSFFDWFQGCNLLGVEKKIQKAGEKYEEGNQTPLPNMVLVSVDKYHTFPARDGEVFKKAVLGVRIEFTVCFFKVFVMIQFNLNIEKKN